MKNNSNSDDTTPSLTTKFRFTKAELQEIAKQVVARGLKQVECCDTESTGLRALVYASGRIVFHSRYILRNIPGTSAMAELLNC